MRVAINTQLFLLLIAVTSVIAGQAEVSESSELVSYAQDYYRQQGVNISRSAFAFENENTTGRIFLIRLLCRSTTLSDDLLQAFLVGGAVSQHARSAINHVVVVAEVEFSHHKKMIFQANGKCCEELYNSRITPEMFTETCLRMK